ncbi:MAG: hypothetical protein IPI67_08010 [Myxococcales bacterium]|nr:hypothetical protein [Myxococcales bacterium]
MSLASTPGKTRALNDPSTWATSRAISRVRVRCSSLWAISCSRRVAARGVPRGVFVVSEVRAVPADDGVGLVDVLLADRRSDGVASVPGVLQLRDLRLCDTEALEGGEGDPQGDGKQRQHGHERRGESRRCAREDPAYSSHRVPAVARAMHVPRLCTVWLDGSGISAS